MKNSSKMLMALAVLLAVAFTVSAVSAEDNGWSFNFFSSDSESTNSDGGAFIYGSDGKLQIQQLKFTLPEGFKENETVRLVGEDANQTDFPGYKVTSATFKKGNDTIMTKVLFGDQKMDDDSYKPSENAQAKKIGDIDGYIEEYDDGVSFDFIEDGKLVEIFASNEDLLDSVIKSYGQD